MEIKVVRQILEWNEDKSDEIKMDLIAKNVFMINVMGSPGAGKTSLITALINELKPKYRSGVIEGDVAGQIDADKMAAMGIPVVQLNTDGACHIEAMSVQHILPLFDLDTVDVLFIENIGNLVCPAEFNIGEDYRLAVLSVPEGDDKVEKYPLLFATTDVLAINKYDMKRYFDFDDKKVEQKSLDINPHVKTFRVSSRDGSGIPELAAFLGSQIENKLKKQS